MGRTYWRSATTTAAVLPVLTAGVVDDATFRLLADNIPTLCWVANGDGYIVWYNRRWYDYCGATPAEMEGWGWTSVHDPELLPSVMERWTASIATGQSFEMVFPLRGADGVFRPFLTRIQPIRDSTGQIARWFGVNTEIADQIAAEEALRIERDRTRDVLERMNEGFVLLGRDFRVLDINAEGMRLERRPKSEIIGHLHWEVWPGTEHSDLGRLYKSAMADGRPAFLEHHYTWPDGRGACIDVRAYPTPDGLAIFYRDVTERKRAEALLREAGARTEALAAQQTAILGQLAEGVIVTDAAGRITFVNDAAARIHGVARLDVEPDAYAETYHLLTLDREPYPSEQLPLARAVRGESILDEGWRIMRPDGAEVVAIGSARPVVDASGEQIGAVLTLRDDTKRAAAERELRENEARLRALTDNLPSGMVYQIATGKDGSERRFLYVSQSHEQLTGVPADAVLADPRVAYDLILPEHGPDLVEAEAQAIAHKAPFDVQVRFRRADGQIRWARIISAPREQSDGSLVWDGLQIDVTDQKAAEALLRDLNETLEARVAERTEERDRAWRLSQDLLVIAEQDGTIAEVNAAWTALLGWEASQLVGRPFVDFTHPDDLNQTLAVFASIFEAPLSTPYEYRFRHKDGSYRWFAWTAAFEQGRVYASGRHTSAEHEQAEALAKAETALRQSQKMEAVGQLTGGIAHDFNNMLAVVIGSLDLLERRLGGADARTSRYLNAAHDGARRAALLTQRLLAFSRQQPLRPEPVDVNKLVAGMSALIRGSLGSDIRLETVLAAGAWWTHADPNQLENVILNLAVNARDAMPEGGRLTIETQNAHLDARYTADHPGAQAGQYVLIAVTDTGAGMPEEVVAKAFDPFFTTKEVGKGTGLGLSQVYGFVRQSGGHVKIYSETGQGTTVKVYMPRLIAPTSAVDAEAATPELLRGDARDVILVVEDEPAVRQFTTDALSELGYRVLEAEGAASALRLLEEHAEVTLLFTDVVMPDVNGRKLADEARRLRPDLKVLFTTGYTRNAVVHNGVLDAGVEMISKPFTVEELAARIREVLEAPAR